jgi:hypothetical protein
LDVVTKNLAVALGSTLSETLAAFSACREGASVQCCDEGGSKTRREAKRLLLMEGQRGRERGREYSRPVMMKVGVGDGG